MGARTVGLNLGDMPLYWRIHRGSSDAGNSAIPPRLPFKFELDPSLGLIIQKRTPQLLDCLERIYLQEFNVGYLQDGHDLSKGYGDDLMRFIEKTIKSRPIKRVIELGCGGCYILGKLKEKGLDVSGVDPSPIAAAKGAEKGIRIVQDFYPSSQISFKTDLLFHADVLEHVSDPVQFLREQKESLAENGILIVSVPDCTESIQYGDISMSLHQHLNYFSQASLANTMRAAGFDVLGIEPARYGGSIYCSAVPAKVREGKAVTDSPEVPGTSFFQKAPAVLTTFQQRVRSLMDRDGNTGFYVPLRAIPYLSTVGIFDGVRLFDDTVHWHGGFIDGIDVAIENITDLSRAPVKELFIMSLTFGDMIKNKVIGFNKNINITLLRDLLR